MANQQLVDYIKSQIAAGVPRLDLEKAVASAGWSQKDSGEAFAVAEGKAPVVPPPPAAPTQPVPGAQPQPMRPATMQMNVQVGARKRPLWPWLVGVLGLVLVGAGVYYLGGPVREIIDFYIGGAPVQPAPQFVPPIVDISTTTINTVPTSTTTATTTP